MHWFLEITDRYHINITIFLIIYFLSGIPLWISIWKLTSNIIRQQRQRIFFWVIILVISYYAPYIYIYFYGENFSFSFHLIFWLFIVIITIFLLYTLRKRLKDQKNSSRRGLFWDLYSLCYGAITNLVPYDNLLSEITTNFLWEVNNKNARILDAGCGSGDLYFKIIKKRQNFYWDGIDFSKPMLNKFRARCRQHKACQNVHLILWDLNDALPYRDGTFDCIISNNVLYAIKDPRKLLIEASRVLKSRGILLLSNPHNKSHFFPIFVNHIQNHIIKSKNRTKNVFKTIIILPSLFLVLIFNIIISIRGLWTKKYHFFNKEELVKILQETNFIIKKIVSVYVDTNWLIIAYKKD